MHHNPADPLRSEKQSSAAVECECRTGANRCKWRLYLVCRVVAEFRQSPWQAIESDPGCGTTYVADLHGVAQSVPSRRATTQGKQETLISKFSPMLELRDPNSRWTFVMPCQSCAAGESRSSLNLGSQAMECVRRERSMQWTIQSPLLLIVSSADVVSCSIPISRTLSIRGECPTSRYI